MSKKNRGKKHNKKKEKQEPVYRTKEDEPIKKLYIEIKIYIQEAQRIEINIPFPEIGRKIIGVLAINVREQVWVKMIKI